MDLDINNMNSAHSAAVTFQGGEEIHFEDGSTGYVCRSGAFKGRSENDDVHSIEIDHKITVPVSAYFCSSTEQSTQMTSENSPSKISNSDSNVMLIPIAVTAFPHSFKGNSVPAYRCDEKDCGKVFSTPHRLKVHQRTHTGEKPFECRTCMKVFATTSALKIHQRVHTGEKPYLCTHIDCRKGFKSASDLQKHIRTHTGERPFKCPFDGCGKRFTTSDICKVHIRTHTGERPHKCLFADCNKSFSNSTNFKNHLRTHTGEKPFRCPVPGCDKRFAEHSSLYKHRRAHDVRMPYQCQYCEKSYANNKTLTYHKKRVHHQYDGYSSKDKRQTKGQAPNGQTLSELQTVSTKDNNVVKASFNRSATMVLPVETIAPTFIVNDSCNPQSLSVLPFSNNLQMSSDSSTPVLVTMPFASSTESAPKTPKIIDATLSSTSSEDEGLIYINKETQNSMTSLSNSSSSSSVVSKSGDTTSSTVIWQNSSLTPKKQETSEKQDLISVGTLEINGTEYIIQVVNCADEMATKTGIETTAELESEQDQPLKDSYYASVESTNLSIVQESINGKNVIQLPVTTISTPPNTSNSRTFASPINNPSTPGGVKFPPKSETSVQVAEDRTVISLSPGREKLDFEKPFLLSAKRRITVQLPRNLSKTTQKS